MASFEIPIKFNLPDDWLDKVVERIKKDGDLVLVTRCENCEYYTEKENKAYSGHFCERMTEFVQPEDFCSYAKPKEMEVK